jgi:hypothetical protein
VTKQRAGAQAPGDDCGDNDGDDDDDSACW